MDYVIVGAGPAGVVAAETLRRTDPHGNITLLGDEPEPPYSRMAIPYLLVENIDEHGTYLRKDDQHYGVQNIAIVRDRVTSVDPRNHAVQLRSGANRHYDRLLLCTGSTPIKPPVPGIDLEGVHNCWTLADARRILEYARPGAKVVLIGAGFIGCIILEALAERKVELTVVEMGDRMVPRMMNATAGAMIKRWCESKGIKVHTDTRVTAIEPVGSAQLGLVKRLLGAKPEQPTHRFAVSLSHGQILPADLVISAAGVKPNIDFLEGSGIETDRGILIDHHMQTSVADVYAAGDVAQGRDFSTGEYAVHAIQPTATEHGRIAAQNMAGVDTVYPGSFNMNVLDTVGLISSSFGLWMGVEDGDQAEVVDHDQFRYLNLQFRGDVLVGATSIGLTQHVGVLRGLIQGEVPLGPWKQRLLDDPTRIMEAYLACNYSAQHAA